MKKVNIEQFNEFAKYYKYNLGSDRFGQAFLNKFRVELVDTELFYLEDYWSAVGIIWAKYVELEE